MAKIIGKEDKAGKTKKEQEQQGVGDAAGNVNSETFLQSVREMAEANEKLAAANEIRKRVRKTIKARGIELGDLDAVVRMADWDREEVRAKFDRTRKYAEWLGLPVGVQGDMFSGMTGEQKAAAEWESTGRTHYLAGRPAQPPEDCPEPYKLNWMRGYKLAAGETVEEKPKEKKQTKDERAAAKARTNEQGQIVAPVRDEAMEQEFDAAEADARAKLQAQTDAALQ